MARVGGIEIPPNKQAWVSLSYVFGITVIAMTINVVASLIRR